MSAFFDTNVIIYSVGGDDRKAALAEDLLRQGGTISVQTLNEIANVSQRKMGHSWARTHAIIAYARNLLSVRDVTQATHERGLMLAERHRLSVYDAMIVAAALEAGCDTLYSEDMHDGLVVDGRLTVANPFA